MFCIVFYPNDRREQAAVEKLHALIGNTAVTEQREIKRLFNRLTNEEFGIMSRLWLTKQYGVSTRVTEDMRQLKARALLQNLDMSPPSSRTHIYRAVEPD